MDSDSLVEHSWLLLDMLYHVYSRSPDVQFGVQRSKAATKYIVALYVYAVHFESRALVNVSRASMTSKRELYPGTQLTGSIKKCPKLLI